MTYLILVILLFFFPSVVLVDWIHQAYTVCSNITAHSPTVWQVKRYEMFTSESVKHTACRDLFIFFFSFPRSTSLLKTFSVLCFFFSLFVRLPPRTHCLILPSHLWALFSPQQPAICKHGSTWLCCPIPSMTSVHLLPLHSIGGYAVVRK